ncbi:succinylglutamate desuccinylase/aspartoacylase domain-containing protein [Paraferrimonas haliotis]|uniref:succinylglutamate desuccinylase/aspartoacylase domain-containing protein n=1 Tax=Paraferrimonas haliotis TaxID=2013866 RepID=UPI000BA98493|nr:succinylglutamate desuccinylase/aspartoacylase family protein [Paraferrimonas haliotis]
MLSIETIQVGELATGQALTVPIYRYHQGRLGPKVYLQANVHGAEVQGNAVLLQLLERLKSCTLNGEVTIVALANPMGINQKSGEFTLGRFDPITGVNWNRQYLGNHIDVQHWLKQQSLNDIEAVYRDFRELLVEQTHAALQSSWGLTTGQHLCYRLQALAQQHDLVIDLHTGPKSTRHLYCPKVLADAASTFNIGCVLMMPNEFSGAMDEACFHPWWQLKQLLSQQGIDAPMAVEAFTLELGSQELIDLKAADDDALGILSYLKYKQVIDDDIQPERMTRYACELKDYRKLHAPKGAMVEYHATLGVPHKQGQVLAKLLSMENLNEQPAITELHAPADAIPVLHFASAAVHQGTELFKLMTNYYEI